MSRAICRRSRPRTSPPRSSRSPIPRSISARWRPKSRGRDERTNPNVVKVVGTPVTGERLRALYFTRATAPAGDGPALSPHRPLCLSPRGARPLRRPAALPARAAREARAVARARSRHAHRCHHRRQRAAGRRHARGPRAGARNPPGRPLTCEGGVRTGTIMTAAKKIVFQGEPGANSHLASREVYPRLRAGAMRDLRGRVLPRSAAGEAELGMIPVENSVAGRVADIHHLMPDSGLHIIAEHFMPVRHQLLAPKGARLDGHQDGREPRPRARPVPQDHPQARHQADRRRRYRRLRARGRRSGRQDARCNRLAAGRRNLRARYPGRGHRGRGPQHHALHRALARRQMGEERRRPGDHHLPVPGAQRAGRALQGARAVSPPTAST